MLRRVFTAARIVSQRSAIRLVDLDVEARLTSMIPWFHRGEASLAGIRIQGWAGGSKADFAHTEPTWDLVACVRSKHLFVDCEATHIELQTCLQEGIAV